jgi:hypothetical protein
MMRKLRTGYCLGGPLDGRTCEIAAGRGWLKFPIPSETLEPEYLPRCQNRFVTYVEAVYRQGEQLLTVLVPSDRAYPPPFDDLPPELTGLFATF